MRYPAIIHLTARWQNSLNENQAAAPGGPYVPARALGFASWRERIKATWLVWTGRADALIWPAGQ